MVVPEYPHKCIVLLYSKFGDCSLCEVFSVLTFSHTNVISLSILQLRQRIVHQIIFASWWCQYLNFPLWQHVTDFLVMSHIWCLNQWHLPCLVYVDSTAMSTLATLTTTRLIRRASLIAIMYKTMALTCIFNIHLLFPSGPKAWDMWLQ